jgi:hypothetical protein
MCRARHAVAIAALAVACGSAVAACGGASGPAVSSVGSTTNTTRSSAAQTAAADGARFVECMRSHGVLNLPDSAVSVTEGQVTFGWPAGVKREAQFPSAFRACQSELPTVGFHKKHFNIGEELNFARCMRSHGITNFPDPTSSGPFPIYPGDANSPQFEAAAHACRVTGIYWNSGPPPS